MKFVTDICPICQSKLNCILDATRPHYVCPQSKQPRDSGDLIHRYEVYQVTDSTWIQNVDVPPFALDTYGTNDRNNLSYSTTLYVWKDDREHPDSPGWQEAGLFPYIPPERAEILIPRIKKLLTFL